MTIQAEPNIDDRILESLREIIRAETAPLKYAGYFQYSITDRNGEPPDVLLDCEPTDQGIGLPSLSRVPMAPGIDGITSKPQTGINCVVTFINRDPTRPIIVGVDSLGVNPVARVGDQVTLFIPPLSPISGVDVIGIPFVAIIQTAGPITGQIVQGSGKVFTG